MAECKPSRLYNYKHCPEFGTSSVLSQSGSTVNLVYVASMLHESPQRYVIKAKSVQYHTVKKSVQYHTVKKSVQYHTIKKLVQYHTVKKSVQYHTVKKDRKAFEVITST